MINRESFNHELFEILKTQKRRKFINAINELMFQNHNMSFGETTKLLNGSKENLEAASIEELYWLASTISIVLKNEKLLKYFTQHEHNAYLKTKNRQNVQEKYPIEFDNVIQIANDQWVTVINTDKLFELYKNQIINYNKNTQRPVIVKEKGGVTEYKIFVNKQSIEEISSLMKQNLFVPNDITLNMNIDNPEIDFEYKNGKIIVYSGLLDIIDGYHRYRAIIKNKLEDDTFEFTMVLNVMNFDEVKACTYIAQQDKRNKINKTVTRTMDATNPINTLIQRLNEDTRCYISGKIGRTETDKINSIWLFELIDSCYKIKDRSEIISLHKYLKNIFNTIVEDELMEYDFTTLAIIIKGSEMYANTNDHIEKIEYMLKNKNKLKNTNHKNKVKNIMIYIEKLAKGEL